MAAKINLTGNRFGRLLVIEETLKRSGSSVVWLCECSCSDGSLSKVYVSANQLREGKTQSCGCLQRDRTSEASLRHGASRVGAIHALYKKWKAVIRRCYNKNTKDYADYGGRGIRVCKEWKESYESFRDYMLSLPNCPVNAQSADLIDREIDRIDNDGHYEPGNVKWSTRLQQSNNTRSNILVKIKGESMTLSEATNRYGKVAYGTVRKRFKYLGWSLKDSLLTPP